MLACFLGLVLGSAGAVEVAAQPTEGSGAATAAPVVEGTAVAADGTTIWYRAVGGGGPEARTLLLIHGGPGISYHYMLGLEALAGPDLRTPAPSGCGTPYTPVSSNPAPGSMCMSTS